MVMGGDSCSKVVSSNPGTVFWMDIFSHTYLLDNCNVCPNRRIKKMAALAHFYKTKS